MVVEPERIAGYAEVLLHAFDRDPWPVAETRITVALRKNRAGGNGRRAGPHDPVAGRDRRGGGKKQGATLSRDIRRIHHHPEQLPERVDAQTQIQ